MAMAMEIVVSAVATGPEVRPLRVVRVDDDIEGHPIAARCDTLVAPGTYPRPVWCQRIRCDSGAVPQL
jgi:hypothetical protein